jgi:hypothetical protein
VLVVALLTVVQVLLGAGNASRTREGRDASSSSDDGRETAQVMT